MSFEDIHRPLSAAGFRGAIRWIVIVSGVALLLQQVFGAIMVPYLSLIPSRVIEQFWIWQVFTYLFLHGGIVHWLFNMLILWMFGRELEVRWGTLQFVKYFFITGIGSALCVLLISPHSNVPTVGASGAIFGLLVAFAMVFPDAVLYLYFVVPVKAWQAVIFFAAIELFTGLNGGGSGLARFAHLGGMATGYLYLRFADPLSIQIRHMTHPLDSIRRWFSRAAPLKAKRPVVFHEVTDDLVKEVDRILDKILRQGVESLTAKEKQMMERYSKLKH